MLITKASLSFPAKVWWAIVHAQLRPTRNDNTLSPALGSLVACLMAGYPVNVGRKLSLQANILLNRLVDRWTEANRVTVASKIKDVANHLFGAKFVVVGILVGVPHISIDIPHVDRGPEQGESSQPSAWIPPSSAPASQATGTFVGIPTTIFERLVADQRQTRTIMDQIVVKLPHVVQQDVLVAKKRIKDEMQRELAVLKDRMDGLEVHVQNQLQAAGSVNAEELKIKLAEMKAKIAKLAEKPVIVPPLVVLESLLSLFTEPPITQTIDDFWGEVPKHKFGKRKHKAGVTDEELPADLSKEERRQQKKARKASKKKAREEEALAQQQRDVMLAGASGSGVPILVSDSQPDPELDSESTPVDKGANADPTTDA
ncbi:hypothetical protein KY284_035627 [Solanum tuberosum]|nr:hypothetical protein KY284_035627 [Solanum tuberosum]